MWLDLGLEVFLRKGEKSVLDVEEFLGGTGAGNWVDLSTLKIFLLRHSFYSMHLSVTKSTGIFPRY